MVRQPDKKIEEVVREVGKYPMDAFQFVQEGLSFTVQEMHGEMTEAQQLIHQFMFENNVDLEELEVLQLNDQLPDEICDMIEQAGGFEELNRHVSGQTLCWGLRNYALQRWGALASAVLEHWNIKRTRDFGEIVFALVRNDFLQKQPHDRLDDFDEVYHFPEALDREFKIDLKSSRN